MPEEHFLRQLDGLMDFSFIYQRVESLYSRRGRPSIDPVVVVKMLLLGYLYGIDSERRLEQEVRVNIAYRWFLGIDLDEPVPDHSTFSQLRRRKLNGAVPVSYTHLAGNHWAFSPCANHPFDGWL